MSTANAATTDTRGSPPGPEAVSWGSSVVVIGSCTAANTGRVFSSADAYVVDAANALERALPGRVQGVNSQLQMANGLSREVDVSLGDLIVQVKSGNARGLTGQLQATTATTGRTAIGYAPDIPNAAWEATARQGIPIARTLDELVAMVMELGG